MLATFSCTNAWGIIAFLTIGVLPPWLELRWRKRPTRVFELHMGLFIALLIGGWSLVSSYQTGSLRTLGMGCLVVAVLIRSGAAPLHCWIPIVRARYVWQFTVVRYADGRAYAAMRLVLPIVPEAALNLISIVSLATALYALACRLSSARHDVSFVLLFLSHSSLVLVGLETATKLGLAAALLVLGIGQHRFDRLRPDAAQRRGLALAVAANQVPWPADQNSAVIRLLYLDRPGQRRLSWHEWIHCHRVACGSRYRQFTVLRSGGCVRSMPSMV